MKTSLAWSIRLFPGMSHRKSCLNLRPPPTSLVGLDMRLTVSSLQFSQLMPGVGTPPSSANLPAVSAEMSTFCCIFLIPSSPPAGSTRGCSGSWAWSRSTTAAKSKTNCEHPADINYFASLLVLRVSVGAVRVR